MKTIERTAELLGELRNTGAADAHAGQAGHLPVDHHLFGSRENAPESVAQRDAIAVASELQRRASDPEPGQAERPLLRIDRGHLRQQNIIAPDGTRSPVAENFRRIKRQILAKVVRQSVSRMPSNLVMVTSALPGEGKTFCAVNLAVSIALEMNRTVLLVDADVAKPSIPRTLGVDVDRGLLDVLVDTRVNLSDALCRTDIGKLTLLPAGSPHTHANELIASETMRLLLEEMAERYPDRVIIFDSPPLLSASEASVLASQMGQIVLVVEANKTPESALNTALSRIEANSVTGVVLNMGNSGGREYGYGEYGHSGAR